MSKIIIKNAIQRLPNIIYYIDGYGNLCGATCSNNLRDLNNLELQVKYYSMIHKVLK